MDRDQILRILDDREAVGRAEVARLEEEAARITVLIEQCQREVDRLTIAREVLWAARTATGRATGGP